MIDKLINPFKYIAGSKSLFYGIIVMIVTAVIGFLSNTHFPDLISVKNGATFPVWYFIIQAIANWFVFSLILYIVAVMASPSSVRAVDIFGTQALARSPYLIAALSGFSGSLNKYGEYTLWKNLNIGDPITISTIEIIIAVTFLILIILCTIWLVTLMYNAFKVSANLKGTKLNIIFFIVFICSTIITSFISRILINIFS